MATRTVFRGDTLQFVVQVLQVPLGFPPDTPPQVVNVTGWTFWFTVKKYFADPDNVAVFQGKSTDGSGTVTITDAPNGKVTLTLPASATLNYPDSVVQLVYDVQGKDTSGNIYTVDSGSVSVSPDVTRAIA